MSLQDNNTILKPGKYFVGDPCYVIDNYNEDHNRVWSDYCDHLFGNFGYLPHVDTLTGISIHAVSTMYGDGTYLGSDGRSYSVDAGLIGVASIDHCTPEQCRELKTLGRIVKFSTPPTVNSDDETGTIWIQGHISGGTWLSIEIETGD